MSRQMLSLLFTIIFSTSYADLLIEVGGGWIGMAQPAALEILHNGHIAEFHDESEVTK